MKTTLVIPTYWGRPNGALFNPADIVYDHPTPLDESGTLARALESLRLLDAAAFDVVVIVGPANPELAEPATATVAGIVEPFRKSLNLSLLTPAGVRRLEETAARAVGGPAARVVNGYGYSNIRNLCLIAARLRQSEVALLIDDDEVVEDPSFLTTALDQMDAAAGDSRIKAKAGWYKRPDGGYKGPPTRDPWWLAWRGAEAMNEGFDAVIAPAGRFGTTPFAFGGNMAVQADIFTSIPFDPKITRGEDIDFVFNTMVGGHEFVMDRQLWIRHLPPRSRVPDWLGFRQNALRFTYARLKLLSQTRTNARRIVTVEELDPYPGRFLRADLDKKIRETCALLGQRYIEASDTAGYDESMFTLQLVEELKRRDPAPLDGYRAFQADWRRLMEWLPEAPADDILDAR